MCISRALPLVYCARAPSYVSLLLATSCLSQWVGALLWGPLSLFPVYSFSPRTSARVHRAFLVRPLMQYQVRFHLHFLTLKQSNSVYFFMVLAGSIYFPARSQQFILWVRLYLTIIPLALVGYEMIDSQRGA